MNSASAITQYARWMREECLPFWASTGLSEDGGVVERMTLEGQPDRPGYKRVRVHARQIYVFSHAHVLGVPGMLEAARSGLDFLLANGRDHRGGWVVKMGEGGGIVDPDLDLYDQAFVILALAWWARASDDMATINTARDTLAVIDRLFARPDRRGYLSRCPDSGEGLQNPHMHLLEALLALHAVDPEGPAAARIAMLRSHFDAALFDPDTGTLGETFAMDWHPAPGTAGQLVEPGHHYEWYFLLHMAERAGFGPADPAAEQLFTFAERFGVRTDTGLIHDALDRQGNVLSDAHRSWPQTERIKALVVRGEVSGIWDHTAIATGLGALRQHYLASAPSGTWIDHVDLEGRPNVPYIPASTLYHLFLAHAELARCAENSPGFLYGNLEQI